MVQLCNTKADFYRRVFPRAVKADGAPVFTHGNFRRQNVFSALMGAFALVNWATSGWYPPYWEYTMEMFACGNWSDNWHAFVGRILDEYPEFMSIHMMILDMWGGD